MGRKEEFYFPWWRIQRRQGFFDPCATSYASQGAISVPVPLLANVPIEVLYIHTIPLFSININHMNMVMVKVKTESFCKSPPSWCKTQNKITTSEMLKNGCFLPFLS